MRIDEAKRNLAKQIERGREQEATRVAQMRLHLYFTGRSHRLFTQTAGEMQAALLKVSAKNDPIDAGAALRIQGEAATIFRDAFTRWVGAFQQARMISLAIPFGGLALTAGRVWEQAGKLEEAASPIDGGVFDPQLRTLLQAGSTHIYADGMDLSARIWNLEQASLRMINDQVMAALQRGDSAWELAKALESQLGAGQDCPRWTEERLYNLTKRDIARGNLTGLLSGGECSGAGVSYNALRMARNEIQIAHQAATDAVFAQIPWIEEEQIILSKQHPALGCECERVTSGGRDGAGIYPKGSISLPLHPQCLCQKLGLQPPDGEFTQRLRGWVRGETAWPAMDSFHERFAGQSDSAPAAILLGMWTFGGADSLLRSLGL